MRVVKIFLVLLAFGCGKGPAPGGKPLVLVSIAPYQFFAERIGGDAIEVRSIVPSAADPHAFEPTGRQVREASQAAVWFRIGEPFEEKMAGSLKGVLVCDLRLSGERHAWVSPRLALGQAEVMARALEERFPERREEFQKNLVGLRGELEALDGEIRSLLEGVEHRALLVSHPAFGPFCRDYGIEQIALEEEGKEMRARQLGATIALAKRRGVQFALALPQHNNKGVERAAEQLEIPVVEIDPYSKQYLQMMRAVAQHLAGHP